VQVTTCDSDTLFPAKYFEALTASYYGMKQRCDPALHSTVWQAPLLYNWGLHLSSVFVRVTALLRTVMTAGLLIPFSVNPMSCFSFSLECAIRGGFWHPQVTHTANTSHHTHTQLTPLDLTYGLCIPLHITFHTPPAPSCVPSCVSPSPSSPCVPLLCGQIHMDDVGFALTLMCGSRSSIGLRLLPLPVISGPTSGATWWQDVCEWYLQVRRWAIGTSDNFHFFVVHLAGLPLLPAIRFALGYFLYYGLVLCSMSLFAVLAAMLPVLYPDYTWDEAGALSLSMSSLPGHVLASLTARQVLLSLCLAPYPLYCLMFLLDRLWVAHVLHVHEPIPLWRNALHFLLTPLTLVLLSLVQLWGYITVALRGKKACTHHLAAKAQLNALPVAR
jgi:hypothetical protein